MKIKQMVKSLCLALVGLLAAVTFADETAGTPSAEDVAKAWVHDTGSSVTILTNTVTGWAFETTPNRGLLKKLVSDVFEELDLSALDGQQKFSNGGTFQLRELEGNLFANKTTLKRVCLPTSVRSIWANVFSGCSDLTEITGLSNVTIINNGSFQNTKIGGELYLPGLTVLNNDVFQNTRITRVEIPKATKLNDQAFRGCTKLTAVVLPAVAQLGMRAFAGCTAFTGTFALTNVTKIGEAAFNGVSGVETFEFPQAKSVGKQAFMNCTALTKLDLPNLQTLSGDQMFNGSGNFKTLKLPHCMTTIDNANVFSHGSVTNVFVHRSSVFGGAAIDGTTKTISGMNTPAGTPLNAQSVAVVTPYGGTTADGWVYDDAVWNAESKTYEIRSDVVTIVAASEATGDLEIPRRLPNGATVTAIEACAFKTHEGLVGKTVTIPKTVSRIGVAAFPQGCTFKVKDGTHAQRLVDQLNAEYGKDCASIAPEGGLIIIVK